MGKLFNKRFRERGNGPMELLLFAPIGLFFLSVAFDTGLGFIERGMVKDAVRDSVRTATTTIEGIGLLTLDNTGEMTPNRVEIQSSVNQAFTELCAAISEARVSDDLEGYVVQVGASVLKIDERTGEVIGQELVGYESSETSEPWLVEGAIEEALERSSESGASYLATPVGRAYNALSPAGAYVKYLPKTLVLYSSVRGNAGGYFGSYVERVIGHKFEVKEDVLQPIRRQL